MELPFLGKKKGGKKSAKGSKGRGFPPTDRSNELMSRGFSELDTIDVLRREGFSADEIDKALTQSIKEGVVGSPKSAAQAPNAPSQTSQPEEGEDAFDKDYKNFRQMRTTDQPQHQAPQVQVPAPQPEPQKSPEEGSLQLPTLDDLKLPRGEIPDMPETSLPDEYYQGYPTEEYIDYAVQEKTGELLSQMNEFQLRNKELENRMKEMSDRVRELGKMRMNEQQQVLNTIEGLTDSVNDVNMRIAALEKAFKETLPALIESVRALCDLVQRMKKEA